MEAKWVCDYCTYLNYPCSVCCVMCKGERQQGPPNHLDIFRLNNKNLASAASHDRILDTEHSLHFPAACDVPEPTRHSEHNDEEEEETREVEVVPRDEQQIHIRNNNNNNNDSSSGATGASCQQVQQQQQQHPRSDRKWPCAVCTYLNWPIALRCTQCLTERNHSSSPLLDAPNAEEDLRAAAEQLQRTLTIRSSSPGEAAAQGGADSASVPSTTTTSSVIKWECQSCTYRNYPKSQKCSMCNAGRSSPIGSPSSNQSSRNVNNNNKLNNKSRANSPGRLSPAKGAASSPVIACDLDAPRSLSPPTRKLSQNNNNNNNNNSEERQLLRKLKKHSDWRWLHACLGVVDNDYAAVEEYLSYGGSPGRSLTAAEVSLLNRNSAFDVGFTLIHLAIRFQREDMLPMLLSQISGTGTGIKRVPSYVAPDLAADIRRLFSAQLRISRKGQFHCHYVQEHATFALPSEIEDLPGGVQEQLFEELLDKDAQKQLETPPPVLNWSLEITVRLGSRLVVLWNRSAGDCLLDSAMQATWGIFDRDNVLRRALADSLHQCAHLFYPRWKDYEMIQASLLHFQLEESQWQRDWANLLALASQPGASLEQLHIFALAHIFRRPILVYGVKFVKSFRGEDIGLARFEGVYLPLMWEPSFCTRSPIALGYTRGHFSALVPTESYSSRLEASANDEDDVTFLPLMDCDMKLLPIHFINETEIGREESLMRQWLDVCMTEGGLMVAQQRINQRPLLVSQLIEEWLNYYRRLAQAFTAPFSRRPQLTGYSYSSDGDTEED